MIRPAGKWLFWVIIPLFAFASCSRDQINERDETEPLKDVVSFESSFGSENLPDDYLLVNPYTRGLEVNLKGEVLIADENWIKIFSSNGQPITRFGGEGEGPGEFRRARDLYLSPNDYLSVFGFGYTANYFRPD
ncbi:MAG: hypothetical protein KAV87_04740 [Desulfobacteraceae bacterium]|nr:hypothetical protein [Desulfobacteraceae bacterium]